MSDWWLVTWGTYGNWLPGDPRGFRTWRRKEYVPPPIGYHEPDEPTYDPAKYRSRYASAQRRMTAPHVALRRSQRTEICNEIVREISAIRAVPAILGVAHCHVHLVARFGETKIRPSVGRLKAAASRQLHSGDQDQSPIWAKGCGMESLESEDDFMRAFNYVKRHREEGAAVHVWEANIEWSFDK